MAVIENARRTMSTLTSFELTVLWILMAHSIVVRRRVNLYASANDALWNSLIGSRIAKLLIVVANNHARKKKEANNDRSSAIAGSGLNAH